MADPIRTFIAIPIDPETAPEAHDFLLTRRRQLLSGKWAKRVRWVTPEHFHLTLRFLGEIPDTAITPLAERLQMSVTSVPSFTLTINQPCLFPRPSRAKIIACPVVHRSELKQLKRRVDDACAPLLPGSADKPNPPGSSYRAHITLGRIRQNERSTKAPNFPSFPGNAELPVKILAILASKLSENGPQHSVLHRIEL